MSPRPEMTCRAKPILSKGPVIVSTGMEISSQGNEEESGKSQGTSLILKKIFSSPLVIREMLIETTMAVSWNGYNFKEVKVKISHFLIAMNKYSTRSKLREEEFIWAHSLVVQSTMVVREWWLGIVGSCLLTSGPIRKQRPGDALIYLACFLALGWASISWGGTTLVHGAGHLPSSINTLWTWPHREKSIS